MEESKKKAVMIAVIIACIAAAGVITYVSSSGSGGVESIERGELMWVKCNNVDCGHEYQTDKRDYYEYIQENQKGLARPAMVCEKCGEESVFRAEKCEKCEAVFFYEAYAGDLPDRCTECGHSTIEEDRKAAREARQQGK